MKYFWIILVACSSIFLLQGCSSSVDTEAPPPTPSDVAQQAGEQNDTADAIPTEVGNEEKENEATNPTGTTTVLIETEFGNMEALLYDDTPGHRDNFVKLVWEWFYDGLLFHRVIDGFMIQGWDPESRDASADKRLGSWGPGYQIPAEIGFPHIKGTLAAARTNNPEKKSSWSQFYISQWWPVTADQLTSFAQQKWITYTPEQTEKYLELWWVPMLDAEYTVFGELTSGLEVIDKIAVVQKAPGDRPVKDVTMKISIIE